MTIAERVNRLGLLAVGLGAAATIAAAGTARADTDIDISIDQIDVFHEGTGATALSGPGDIAIAIGPNSGATAEQGFGDFAFADSTGGGGASAIAGDDGTEFTNNDFDFASAIGNNVVAEAGFQGNSEFDVASTFGNESGSLAGYNGSYDYASAIGYDSFTNAGLSYVKSPADFDSATVFGNLFAPLAGGGSNFADAGGFPPADLGGSNDLAFIFDPFAAVGSTATAGVGNSFDLAGDLGDNLNATATGADFLAQILPLF